MPNVSAVPDTIKTHDIYQVFYLIKNNRKLKQNNKNIFTAKYVLQIKIEFKEVKVEYLFILSELQNNKNKQIF